MLNKPSALYLFRQRQTAFGYPVLAAARRISVLVLVGDQVSYIENIDHTVTVGIAATDLVRCRWIAFLVLVINQPDNVENIYRRSLISLTRDAVANKGTRVGANDKGQIERNCARRINLAI